LGFQNGAAAIERSNADIWQLFTVSASYESSHPDYCMMLSRLIPNPQTFIRGWKVDFAKILVTCLFQGLSEQSPDF
jgi:hypothetical protein